MLYHMYIPQTYSPYTPVDDGASFIWFRPLAPPKVPTHGPYIHTLAVYTPVAHIYTRIGCTYPHGPIYKHWLYIPHGPYIPMANIWLLANVFGGGCVPANMSAHCMHDTRDFRLVFRHAFGTFQVWRLCSFLPPGASQTPNTHRLHLGLW
jgi:hypothetical protein